VSKSLEGQEHGKDEIQKQSVEGTPHNSVVSNQPKEKTVSENETAVLTSSIRFNTTQSNTKTRNRFLSATETYTIEEEAQSHSESDSDPPLASGIVHIKEQQTGIDQTQEGEFTEIKSKREKRESKVKVEQSRANEPKKDERKNRQRRNREKSKPQSESKGQSDTTMKRMTKTREKEASPPAENTLNATAPSSSLQHHSANVWKRADTELNTASVSLTEIMKKQAAGEDELITTITTTTNQKVSVASQKQEPKKSMQRDKTEERPHKKTESFERQTAASSATAGSIPEITPQVNGEPKSSISLSISKNSQAASGVQQKQMKKQTRQREGGAREQSSRPLYKPKASLRQSLLESDPKQSPAPTLQELKQEPKPSAQIQQQEQYVGKQRTQQSSQQQHLQSQQSSQQQHLQSQQSSQQQHLQPQQSSQQQHLQPQQSSQQQHLQSQQSSQQQHLQSQQTSQQQQLQWQQSQSTLATEAQKQSSSADYVNRNPSTETEFTSSFHSWSVLPQTSTTNTVTTSTSKASNAQKLIGSQPSASPPPSVPREPSTLQQSAVQISASTAQTQSRVVVTPSSPFTNPFNFSGPPLQRYYLSPVNSTETTFCPPLAQMPYVPFSHNIMSYAHQPQGYHPLFLQPTYSLASPGVYNPGYSNLTTTAGTSSAVSATARKAHIPSPISPPQTIETSSGSSGPNSTAVSPPTSTPVRGRSPVSISQAAVTSPYTIGETKTFTSSKAVGSPLVTSQAKYTSNVAAQQGVYLLQQSLSAEQPSGSLKLATPHSPNIQPTSLHAKQTHNIISDPSQQQSASGKKGPSDSPQVPFHTPEQTVPVSNNATYTLSKEKSENVSNVETGSSQPYDGRARRTHFPSTAEQPISRSSPEISARPNRYKRSSSFQRGSSTSVYKPKTELLQNNK